MRVIGVSISKPTKINAGPYACGGIAEINGAKNSVPTKQSAVTTEVNPVRPPASTPVADSMYAPEVVVPITAAKVVASASAIIGPLDLRQIAVFVEESRARRNANQSSHRVDKSHDEDGQDDGKESPAQKTMQIKLHENRRQAGRAADP